MQTKEFKKQNQAVQVIKLQLSKMKNQIIARNEQIQKYKHHNDKKNKKEWGLISKQKKIGNTNELASILEKQQEKTPLRINSWDYGKNKQVFKIKLQPKEIYYPPNCSGYDIAYVKELNTIYVYGGISCLTQLSQGIHSHFYKFHSGKWSEVQPNSTYTPVPRYGHTLTAVNKELILFGGVSEFKSKLKDRCFYTDLSSYSPNKNRWRIVDTTGSSFRTRRNHSAASYHKYYIIHGGIDECGEVINQISWINLQAKQCRLKSMNIDGRFFHKLVIIQSSISKDYLCIVGGRNNQFVLTNKFTIIPIGISDSQLLIKDSMQILNQIKCRELPLVSEIGKGFIILGGKSQDNCNIDDAWYFNAEMQYLTQLDLDIDYQQIRGSQAISLTNNRIYILTHNSTKYRALEVYLD